MAKLFNRAKVLSSTTGTGTLTLGAAYSNAFCTFAEAGVANSDVVSYVIEDGTDFEIGIGTYTTSGTTLTRTTVTLSKIAGVSGTTKITCSGNEVVFIDARKEDLLSISETQTANQVFAGPTSGGAAVPAFRAVVAADLPSVLTPTTIDLGNADTTVARDSAGVISVEGVPLYSNIPQNSQSAAYTLVLADAQKHIFHPSADTTARTWTIPANSSVAYPIGTAITIVNQISGGVITIAIPTDTMWLAGAGTTGSRSLAANGIATAIKITSTGWIISGTGLT